VLTPQSTLRSGHLVETTSGTAYGGTEKVEMTELTATCCEGGPSGGSAGTRVQPLVVPGVQVS
jgi:hypothetical protein